MNNFKRPHLLEIVGEYWADRPYREPPEKPQGFPRFSYRDCTMADLDLVDTSTAHPEQYDVFAGGVVIGYMRLRHGTFTVEAPYCGGTVVFSIGNVPGGGEFESDRRDLFLEVGVRALRMWWLLRADCGVFDAKA